MSEIQDAAQIIRVSLEGTELILKMGKANWDFVKGVCAVFQQMTEREKLEGKTSVKQLLKSGGDLQVFKFRTEDMRTVKKLADKYGLLYSILPDLNKEDGMSEILFHSQAAPRIQAIMERIQGSRIESMDDYFANGRQEELDEVTREAQKEYGDKTNPGIFREENPLSGFPGGSGVSAEKMEEIRKFQKSYIENPNVNGITIARKMVMEETQERIKTRIPYKQKEFLWLPKAEITWINNDKTIYAGLEKDREYQVVDELDRPIRKVSGQELYKQSYDPVNKDLAGREQERLRRRKDQVRRREAQQGNIQQGRTRQDERQKANVQKTKEGKNGAQKNVRRTRQSGGRVSKGTGGASPGRRVR